MQAKERKRRLLVQVKNLLLQLMAAKMLNRHDSTSHTSILLILGSSDSLVFNISLCDMERSLISAVWLRSDLFIGLPVPIHNSCHTEIASVAAQSDSDVRKSKPFLCRPTFYS